MTTTDTRSIEVELSMDAPPEAVWKALTDPEELTRWFPFDAKTEPAKAEAPSGRAPGPGGYLAHSWGAALQGRNRIKLWEPETRLQTTWFEPTDLFGKPPEPPKDAVRSAFQDDPEGAARLLVDYFLEGGGGTTVLRLVHSGFSKDARWDEEFTSHRRGWNFELRSLRNYLNHHLGKERHVVWVRRPVSGDLRDAWERIVGRDALARAGSIDGAVAGRSYDVTTVHGDRLQGEVFNAEPPAEFAGAVANLDHSLLRCGIEAYSGRPEAMFWLSTWGESGRAERFRNRWTETMQSLFA